MLFTAQASKGFRLGGINDPLNVALCSDEDLVTYSGFENWDDEEVMNYELGAKTRLADGRVTFNASVFVTKIDGLQVIADAGTCSSRVIINADAETPGAELELFVRPNESLGSRPLGDLGAGRGHRIIPRPQRQPNGRHSRRKSAPHFA